ncbi:DUF6923 family protein [Lyngbya aestuarii]|uniref:DUF6923 family protein n=1 Tax=Lyngbya aestuarii TaxID=118322 RepID=UPI00403DEB0F
MHQDFRPSGLLTRKNKAPLYINLAKNAAKSATGNPNTAKKTSSRSPNLWGGIMGSLTLLMTVVGYAPDALAQFVCDTTNYISEGDAATAGQPTPTQLNRIDTTTNNFALTPIGFANVNYNAIGFNTLDRFIYGINPFFAGAPVGDSPLNRTVYRIDPSGTATPLGIPQGLPATGFFFAGDFNPGGNYVILSRGRNANPAEGNRLVTLDITTSPPTVLSNIQLSLNGDGDGSFAGNPPQFDDIAFNPTTGNLYSFDRVRQQLALIDPASGAVQFIGQSGVPENVIVGGLFFNSSGQLFAYTSPITGTGGNFYEVNLNTGGLTNARATQPVTLFDGANCAIAPTLSKVVAPETVVAGGTVTYTYTLTNSTAFPFTDLTLDEQLPQLPGLPNALTFVDGTLTIGGFQDGTGTPNAYGGTSSLQITGLTIPANTPGVVSVQVRVSPDTPPGPLLNGITLEGFPPGFLPTIPSDFPPTPQFPDDTPLQIAENPVIGVVKNVTSVTNNGDGSFAVTYGLVVENLGNVPLNNIQLLENLDGTFGAGNFTISGVSSPTLTTNNSFNGSTDANLLAGTETLPVNGTATVEFVAQVRPPDVNQDYTNQVQATGTSPAGQAVEDLSNNGVSPDPDGDGNPKGPENDVPTVVNFQENPVIGVAKNVASANINNDGSFTVTYGLVVENLGNVPLNNIQLLENLDGTFGAGNFTISGVSSPTLTTNNSFNGSTDANLLAGTETLPVNGTATVEFVAQVRPPDVNQDYTNQVQATGTSPAGQAVEDLSNNGVSPDPDGDGNPKGPENDVPTVVNFQENPVIGVAKNVASANINNDGSFTVTYGLVVENLGNVPLNNVQLLENLDETFGAGNFTVSSVSSPNLATNNNFNGTTDPNLLAGTDTLAPDGIATVEFVIQVTPPGVNQDYANQVEATGISPGGQPVSDLSNNGVNPDPNDDGNPNEPENNTPTVVNFQPRLRLVKRITNVTRGGVPISGVAFNSFVNDSQATADLNAAGFTPTGIPQIDSDTILQSGDQVEYTVYFISDGSQPAANAKICDSIPEGTEFIPGSISWRVGEGIGNVTPTFVEELDLSPPFSSPPCRESDNSNGAVLAELGNISNTSPDNVGYVRFQVEIE